MREENLRGIYKIRFGKKLPSVGRKEKNIFQYQKQLEHLFCEGKFEISIYEFREIIERFIGLTLAIQDNNERPSETEENIFR
ncbi:MAG: hypothetical protein ABR566_06945, partial [Pyrinomonadaceae bacterium]